MKSNITSCVCYDKTFVEIKVEAEKLGLSSVEQIQERLDCAKGCGLCIEYIEQMIQTGKTEF